LIKKLLSFLNSLPKDKEKVHMTAITVGDNPASLLYVSRKKDKAVELGIDFHWEKLNADTSQNGFKQSYC
jgi:5,10-methylene-tetrahydrofolate dehydrogenase/methenyl tetrahydrofolate cyclohydrolase